jgi:hypothetical protein
MEGAKHRLVRSEGTTRDPPGQGEPSEGGSATGRKPTRSADTLRVLRGTASNSIGPQGPGNEWHSGDSADS